MNHIPHELINLDHWIVWKAVPNPDPTRKDLKIPINVKTGNGASTTNPGTWASYEDVQGFLDEWKDHEHSHHDKSMGELTGIVIGPGFVFSKDDPFCGIDLDACIDDSGKLNEWAKKIHDLFRSYTEISQSGNGIHIIVKGKKPEGSGCKKGDLECYDRDRFFAITGNIYGGGK